MPDLTAELPAVEAFVSQGLITEVISTIKSGKEATAYLCRLHPSLGAEFGVAKVYHERGHRDFANDALYQEGRIIGNQRTKRAVGSRTEFGRLAQGAIWVDYEFERLSALEYAGADVPAPYASDDQAILMEFIRDADGEPAPQLQHARLNRDEAEAVLDRVLWNVRLWLSQDVVHGDLSAFNLLWDGQRPVAIDFPQSVDPRQNRHAQELLERDLANVARYFARYGMHVDAERLARRWWNEWKHGEL